MELDSCTLGMIDCNIRNNNDIKKYCVQLKQAGLLGVCFTEPVLYSGFSLKKAVQKNLKDFKILNGIDISFNYDTHEAIAINVAGSGLDYVVNSVTDVNGVNINDDKYFLNKSRNQAYSEYFEKVYDSLDALYEYNVLGPLGAVQRIAYYPSPLIELREFADIIDAILMRTVFTGKGIEVDTSAISVFNQPIPSFSILKRYKELGGEIITLASHATVPESIGTNFKIAAEILKNCGFKYSSYFVNGKVNMLKL
jgi:histidinol-phosphatase (PHP family)